MRLRGVAGSFDWHLWQCLIGFAGSDISTECSQFLLFHEAEKITGAAAGLLGLGDGGGGEDSQGVS